MEIAIIALFIVSIALIAFSYSQRDPMKDVEQEPRNTAAFCDAGNLQAQKENDSA